MNEFSQRDPLTPAFWDERFARHCTPWDRGRAPQALRDFVAAEAPRRTLIPGCGAGHELALLAGAGWDVTAIDFSPAAVAAGKIAAGPFADRVVTADFFSWQPAQPLQLIYEQAFLCAMPRAMWSRVAARWAQLLPPAGLLAGYFYFDVHPKGPPFGIARAALDALLDADFICELDDAVADSIPIFAGKERWMVWRRR